jgi:hypothetical protein
MNLIYMYHCNFREREKIEVTSVGLVPNTLSSTGAKVVHVLRLGSSCCCHRLGFGFCLTHYPRILPYA